MAEMPMQALAQVAAEATSVAEAATEDVRKTTNECKSELPDPYKIPAIFLFMLPSFCNQNSARPSQRARVIVATNSH
jgi:hypothetical protein